MKKDPSGTLTIANGRRFRWTYWEGATTVSATGNASLEECREALERIPAAIDKMHDQYWSS